MLLRFEALWCTKSNKFAILVNVLYFVSDAKRSARRLIALHPKQNIESELKWQTCSGTTPTKFSCLSGRGLDDHLEEGSKQTIKSKQPELKYEYNIENLDADLITEKPV